MEKKRIGIDARFYGPIGKGLGRYTQEVVDNILKLDEVNDYVIFLNRHNFNELQVENKRVKKVLADVRWYTLAGQLVMPWLLNIATLDLVHFPHFNVPVFYFKKFVVTIHDLILFRYPTVRASTLPPLLYWLKNFFYRLVIWLAVHRSAAIITVSKFTKNDLVEHFHVKREKIKVIYEGVANLSKNRDTLFDKTKADKKDLFRYNINKPFFLYVGNAYPHKNLDRLFKVFRRLAEKNPGQYQLVLVGKSDFFYERLKGQAQALGLYEPEKNSQIIFTGFVTDQELELLFQEALAYVFPSLYEGFGLPPLEAMAKGCPVASSRAASLPEILGSAALYFDPTNEDEMLKAMESLATDKNLRTDLQGKGYTQIKKYSWWECARATKDLYDRIIYGEIQS